jgi:hypothetical protein
MFFLSFWYKRASMAKQAQLTSPSDVRARRVEDGDIKASKATAGLADTRETAAASWHGSEGTTANVNITASITQATTNFVSFSRVLTSSRSPDYDPIVIRFVNGRNWALDGD